MNRFPRKLAHPTGALIQEAVIATVLASAMMLGVAQMASVVIQQRRAMEQRGVALREAGNMMEELLARDWQQLDSAAPPRIEISAAAAQQLQDPAVRVNVADQEDGARRISVEVDWRVLDQRRAAPVRLIAWRYPRVEEMP